MLELHVHVYNVHNVIHVRQLCMQCIHVHVHVMYMYIPESALLVHPQTFV